MTSRFPRFALATSLTLASALVGCSSKTPETDTAVVSPDPAVKPAPAPAPSPTPPTTPTKD